MKSLMYIITVFFAFSCNSESIVENVSFKKLPSDVREKFNYVYNYYEPPKVNAKGDTITYMAPFSECYSLNKNCSCKIESKGGIVRNPFFIIKSCSKEIKISWEVLERVFIIKNDSIYYPYHTYKIKYEDVNNGKEFDQVVGGHTTMDKPRSYNVKIDTLNFRVQKMDW